MATNRAYDLDEAMHRRITLAVEFSQPDPVLREKIWRTHLPAELKLADDVDLHALSMNYELTGGFIKNAILVALSKAVARDPQAPVVSQADLNQGAMLQLRGCMQMNDFDSRVIPTTTFNDLVLPETVRNQIYLLKMNDFELVSLTLTTWFHLDVNTIARYYFS
jgi:hypothetical protein